MKYFIFISTLLSFACYGNQYHDFISNKNEADQNRILGKLLDKSGKPCAATKSYHQGFDKENTSYWNVACSNGSSYAIAIREDVDAKTRILDCSVLQTIGIPCFKKLEQ